MSALLVQSDWRRRWTATSTRGCTVSSPLRPTCIHLDLFLGLDLDLELGVALGLDLCLGLGLVLEWRVGVVLRLGSKLRAAPGLLIHTGQTGHALDRQCAQQRQRTAGQVVNPERLLQVMIHNRGGASHNCISQEADCLTHHAQGAHSLAHAAPRRGLRHEVLERHVAGEGCKVLREADQRNDPHVRKDRHHDTSTCHDG
mmetsp:Transcript_88664/g.253884  ORF Transcript_88664/g.253884 Transcript_88664/m.253884 type:complete len:200 (+) Transcript_88664:149-748(+)